MRRHSSPAKLNHLATARRGHFSPGRCADITVWVLVRGSKSRRAGRGAPGPCGFKQRTGLGWGDALAPAPQLLKPRLGSAGCSAGRRHWCTTHEGAGETSSSCPISPVHFASDVPKTPAGLANGCQVGVAAPLMTSVEGPRVIVRLTGGGRSPRNAG